MKAKNLLKVRPIDETGKCLVSIGQTPITDKKFDSEEEAQKWINEQSEELLQMIIAISGEIFGVRMEILNEEAKEHFKELEKEMSNKKEE